MMGLDLSSKSRFEYHAGYNGLHQVRFEGGLERMTSDGSVPLYDWAFVVCCVAFPNLMMHSDCDGRYTKNGRVDPLDGQLQTGNSVQLLRELRALSDTAAIMPGPKTYYDMLLAVVADAVENHDGRIEFR